LGIDPVPLKACNYNCVYCQLGRSTLLVHQRQDFFSPQDILAEALRVLAGWDVKSTTPIDFITFVGQGEPLLCASLGWLIRQVKAHTDIPVAVITNGSLLFLPEVRQELSAADVVLPSLDAADEATFRRINRPWSQLHIGEIVRGMAAFRRGFAGRLWVEVMLVRGVNDDDCCLQNISTALAEIGPDQVHINVPIRPPAETWVQPPDDAGLKRAADTLGDVAQLMLPGTGAFYLDADLPVADAVEQIIRRHPIREHELSALLSNRALHEIAETLQQLELEGRARRLEFGGQLFWTYAGRR
jgi:wyosine [tRNA(Phe)-imidazoG37] synthetase (radical SAM superfamily)